MSLNTSRLRKLLLTAGLLIVLGQGLWQLPELQDYLSPVDQVEFILSRASKECASLKADIITLNKRVDYLKWFQAHNGPEQKISAERWRAFPFSESIRSLAPRLFWDSNIRLAHKNRRKVERKLLYLDGLLKNIDANPPTHPSQGSPAMPAPISNATKQIQQYQDQSRQYKAKLMELSQQLAGLESNGYKE